MTLDVAGLTASLVRVDTAGAREDEALAVVAPLLEDAGFAVRSVPWMPGRSNLVATWNGGGAFALSGHVDTVPHGTMPWQRGPLSADRDGDRLVGRGSSDMKGGVAAIVVAAVAAAERDARGFAVVLTAGEETGCGGARAVRDAELLDPAGILVIGESTGNRVRLGHKGATWLEARASGRAAHGSTPELGSNAIERLADAVIGLRVLDAGPEHPRLGSRTTNVGTIAGGTQTNLVPDSATMTVDVRTVPGASHLDVQALLAETCVIETLLDLPAIWTPEDSATTSGMLDAVSSVTGRRDEPAGVPYFTDAAILDAGVLRAGRSRSYIVGPGDADQPHTLDESVSVTSLEQAVEIYAALLDAWGRGALD